MNHLRSIWRTVNILALVVACWAAGYGTALAQGAETQEKGGSWIPSYTLVLAGILLGMVGVCLTSRRRDRAKPESYEKRKILRGEKD